MKRKMMASLLILALGGLGVLSYEYFGKAETTGTLWGSSEMVVHPKS